MGGLGLEATLAAARGYRDLGWAVGEQLDALEAAWYGADGGDADGFSHRVAQLFEEGELNPNAVELIRDHLRDHAGGEGAYGDEGAEMAEALEEALADHRDADAREAAEERPPA